MLQCRQGGEGDETAKGHWPAPEGELAGTAFSAAQPVGAVPVLSVPTGRNGSGQLYGPAAQPGRRVGNYRALFQNTAFRLAVRNTCRFLCICIPALLAVSLLCAVLLGAAKRRAVFFKSVLLLPYAIPVASIVVLWRALFSGKGLVNGLLVGLGCRPVDFMGSSAAFWVLIFTYLWRNNGYDMLLWLAGLETIPRPLYEAAAVDGATPFQTFVFITLPNLLPTVVLTTILSLVNSFKVFREAYLVAGNYPQESIYLLQHLFNNWFLSLDIGKLSAAAVLLALGLGCVVYLLYHFWGGGQE